MIAAAEERGAAVLGVLVGASVGGYDVYGVRNAPEYLRETRHAAPVAFRVYGLMLAV